MTNHRPLGTIIALTLVLAFAAASTAQSESPLSSATAVWQMDKAESTAGTLEPNGKVEVGVRLEGADLAASLARGGDGYVARFDNGYLETRSAAPIQLNGKDATICLRLHDRSGTWNSCLLATADPKDRLANLVYSDGSDLIYRWRTTPPWQRVEGIAKPKPGEPVVANYGTYGFNGESNDAHDLLKYPANHWVRSVLRVYEDGRVVVADQNQRAEGRIDSDRQQTSDEAFYVGSKAGVSEFLSGEIAEILVFHRPLSDEETEQLLRILPTKKSAASAASSIPRDGLVLHLDASEVESGEDGAILRWKDLSGRGNDVCQSDAACRPKRLENACEGLPAIRFTRGQFLKGPAVLKKGDDEVPHNVRIRMNVVPSQGVEAFGVCLRGEGDYASGSELCFRPAENHVQFGHAHNGILAERQPVKRKMDGDAGAMPPVTGLDRPMTLDIIMKDRILDVCIDNRRTFIARRNDLGGKSLFLFAKGGQVAFEQIEICPLLDE